MVICISEDRKSCETSVKLLVLSLVRHCPQVRIELFYPPADASFYAWLQRYPQVGLNVRPFAGVSGYNVKPLALLSLLEAGCDEVIWVDSDIIVARDFRHCFSNLPTDTLMAAEEALNGAYEDTEGMRARAWGFHVGRVFDHAINSCVVRVTQSHRTLLEHWRHLLESSAYQEAQKLTWSARPAHMYGDQDVLTALLSSREFAGVPCVFLRRGRDIVQYFGLSGYTVKERMLHMASGIPPFLHSQVYKPWLKSLPDEEKGIRQYFNRLYLDLSPYTLEARKFRSEMDEDCSWIKPRLLLGRILRVVGLGWIPLVGLPLAACVEIASFLKRTLKGFLRSPLYAYSLWRQQSS
ncbi:nucleotide-diphospho-sugar transferase [Geobacter sp. SVR]|uniref:nucleotide-diphospho-sugar transferase n=1 Tax=Geobacter sp. SVR TaxID=2495594 RepID=UPI00143EFD18|nr:nucleotide-diphospho-sugar transferase [Geobacter sp. SVR]BCS54958.1 hypothetical protein GSVR_32660 [Geobacter sp. SVR]GCF86157.1 hypothetical protein GSbR_27570 [Geobacter sp. SVR]